MEAYPANNFGAGAHLACGTIQNNACSPPFLACRNRALLKFDLTDPTNGIPRGSTILTAGVVMDVSHAPPNDETDPNLFHELHRVLVPWTEGTRSNFVVGSGVGSPPTNGGGATWIYRMSESSNTWTIPGGAAGIDYLTNVSISAYVIGIASSPYYFLSTPGSVADVQFWLDHPEQNFGWISIVEDETRRWTAKRFVSREVPLSIYPALGVSYTPPPVPRFDRTGVVGDRFHLYFTALQTYTYTVQFKDSLDLTNWTDLTTLGLPATTAQVQVVDPLVTNRVYRLLRQ